MIIVLGVCEAVNGQPMLGERAAHGQPTARFGNAKNSSDCSRTKMVHEKLLNVMLENE